MNFFVDENIPNVCCQLLRGLGHVVFDVRGTEKEGAKDHLLFTLAQLKSATFITTDKDFFHTIPHQFSSHHGVIIISLSQPNRDSILKRMKWGIENINFEEIRTKIILLSDNNCTML